MKFNCISLFKKDLKKLSKKIPSLEKDLENFQRFIGAVQFGNNKRFIILCHKNDFLIVKTRLMARSMKGTSKTRLIFAVNQKTQAITFIELYLKNKSERENQLRIKNFLQNYAK